MSLEGTFSKWKTVRTGLTQGTVLAPLLNKVHVADIPRKLGIELTLVAMDTSVFTSNENFNYSVTNLNIHINISVA
jgi:hypothetical protein